MSLPKGFYVGDSDKKRSKLTGYLILSGGLIIMFFPVAYLFYWGFTQPRWWVSGSLDPLTVMLLLGGMILGGVMGGYVAIIGQFWAKPNHRPN